MNCQVPSVLGDAKDTEMLQSPRENGYQCRRSREARSAGPRADGLRKPLALRRACSDSCHLALPSPLLQLLLWPPLGCFPHHFCPIPLGQLSPTPALIRMAGVGNESGGSSVTKYGSSGHRGHDGWLDDRLAWPCP